MKEKEGAENKLYDDLSEDKSYQKTPPKNILNYFLKEKISDFIGTAEEAKNSVVWYVVTRTIRYSWVIIFLLVLVDIYNTGGAAAIDIIVKVSSIFIPIITLALGYLFGKKDSEK
ncbi:hypothetical protein [Pectobacterium sp. A5351]|uniref:hypothetical protein n=1 Tax=Pectobacterium sp. A5351 TaxID=2914983 RepID=UPI00232C4A8E|nr:hypothetical protein [Pectobacterium sp. A5351]WCG83356.1 hypothetical protein O1Q74_01180 [Pectobacterium sp. A5351]